MRKIGIFGTDPENLNPPLSVETFFNIKLCYRVIKLVIVSCHTYLLCVNVVIGKRKTKLIIFIASR